MINVLYVVTVVKHFHELLEHGHVIFADFDFGLWNKADFFGFKFQIGLGVG